MRTHRFVAGTCVALMCVAGLALAAETNVTSGPQVGTKVPGPFHPLNINGAKAGEKNCLYCQNGANPVAMVFARDVSEPLTKLIKELDSCTAKHGDAKMGSFVVFLSDEESLAKQLKEVADKEKLQHTVLAIDNSAGPQNYKVAKDADVTVIFYNQRKVEANHAFKKGELNDKAIDAIMADVKKILPDKKGDK